MKAFFLTRVRFVQPGELGTQAQPVTPGVHEPRVFGKGASPSQRSAL